MSNMFLDDILQLTTVTESLKDLVGRYPGAQLGICTDREDPSGLGQIRATVSNLGAKTETGWLVRLSPCPGLSLPVPALGDTVVVLYKDGDPHQGFYVGVVQNILNPLYHPDGLQIRVGQVLVTITPDGTLVLDGLTGVSVAGQGSLSVSGFDSVAIAGKQVATLGAVDNRGDRLVSKGWS